jgi:hypothetical protein
MEKYKVTRKEKIDRLRNILKVKIRDGIKMKYKDLVIAGAYNFNSSERTFKEYLKAAMFFEKLKKEGEFIIENGNEQQ